MSSSLVLYFCVETRSRFRLVGCSHRVACSGVLVSMGDAQSAQRPVVVGIAGSSGCGKTVRFPEVDRSSFVSLQTLARYLHYHFKPLSPLFSLDHYLMM